MAARVFHIRSVLRLSALALLCAALFAVPGEALAGGAAASSRRSFKAQVSRNMATTAAMLEARLAAMGSAVRDVVQQDEARLFLGGEVIRAAPRPDPMALAWAMLEHEEAEVSISGVPPDMQVHAVVRVRLASTGASMGYLARLLERPDILEIYRRSLELQAEALSGYDDAAAYFLRPGAPLRQGDEGTAALVKDLESAYARLEAAVTYLALMPALYPFESAIPEDSGGELLSVMERLSAMSPENYIIRSELGRLKLLHGHAPSARSVLDEAIAMRPDFAQSHDRRGQCLLWQGLPSLALVDFDRAILLEPYHPDFFENRAITNQVLENWPAMCRDLAESCRLGECGGLEWAKSEGICEK